MSLVPPPASHQHDPTHVAIKRVQTTESESARTCSADSTDSAQAIASIKLTGGQAAAGSSKAAPGLSAKANLAQKLSEYFLPLFSGSKQQQEQQEQAQQQMQAQQQAAKMAAAHGVAHHDAKEKQQPLAPSGAKQHPGIYAAASLADRMSIDTVSLSHGNTQSTSSNYSVMSAQSLGQAISPTLCSPSTSTDSETTAAVVYPMQQQQAKQPTNLRPVRRDLQMLSLAPTVPPRMQRREWCLDDYTILEKLYTGYASTVYKAVCRRSAETVVLKVYHLTSVCELYRFQIYREVRLHASLQHEFVVQLYAAFQEGDKVVMVQEYADGNDLFSLLHRYGGRLSERVAVQLVLDPFLRVLHYLHTRGIVHRDIKPENILFSKDMRLKLADFGLAIDLREERAVTRAGTLDYMAPEVLRCPFKSKPEENKEKSELHYSNRVDAWAVGVLTYELLVGFPPFFDQSRTGTEDRIRSSIPVFPSNMSEDAKSFICSALQKMPLERPTVLEMLQHPFIESFRNRRSMRQLPVQKPTTPRSNLQAPTTPQGQQQTFISDEQLLHAVANTPPRPAAIPHPAAAAEALQLKAASMNAVQFNQWTQRAKQQPGQL